MLSLVRMLTPRPGFAGNLASILKRALKCALVIALSSGAIFSLTTDARADRLLPIVEAGGAFMSGDSGKSLSGTQSYFLSFRAESDRGFYRPSVAMEIPYSTGTTLIEESEIKYRFLGASFNPGFNLFPFKEGHLMPFLGGAGILCWSQLQLTDPPGETEPNTQSFAYGYEVSAGIDLRMGSREGSALRIRGSYWNLSTQIGGISGFQLKGVRFFLGYVF